MVERSIHSNRYVYLEVAKNHEKLTMDEYLILTQQYETLCSQFDLKPDMIIYLRSDPVTAYERMVSRWFSVGICKYKPGYKSHDLL